MNNKTLNQLIKLYEDQITQLEVMSKIELGDDVIEEINKLKSELENTYTKTITSNNKQTAVEWLGQQIYDNLNDIYHESRNILEFVEKAKEMEAEQMEDCWRFGRGSYIDKEPETFEQYYNKEYGGETMTAGENTNNNPGNTTLNTYRKKPVTIEALQWTGNNHRQMFNFLGGEDTEYMTAVGTNFYIDWNKVEGGLVIKLKLKKILPPC